MHPCCLLSSPIPAPLCLPVGVSVQPDLPFKRHRYTHGFTSMHTCPSIHLFRHCWQKLHKMLFSVTKPQFDAVKPQHTLREVSILAYKVSLASSFSLLKLSSRQLWNLHQRMFAASAPRGGYKVDHTTLFGLLTRLTGAQHLSQSSMSDGQICGFPWPLTLDPCRASATNYQEVSQKK